MTQFLPDLWTRRLEASSLSLIFSTPPPPTSHDSMNGHEPVQDYPPRSFPGKTPRSLYRFALYLSLYTRLSLTVPETDPATESCG